MNNQQLFKKTYDQILDYADDELLWRCSGWGYTIHERLLKEGRYLAQGGAESASPFMYAVSTAVIVSEFAKFAFNDNFSEEIEIDLAELGMYFSEVRGLLDEDIEPERVRLLEEADCIGLQDFWGMIWEWKAEIYKSLVGQHKKAGEKDPNHAIFQSLHGIFQDTDKKEIFLRSMTDTQKIASYDFINNGFKY